MLELVQNESTGSAGMTLRQAVAELMVEAHDITRELADYHTCDMNEVDLAWRFEDYMRRRAARNAETELGVANAQTEPGSISTRFLSSATPTARSRHSTLFPHRPGG